ncbi:hypothetical protein, partial [uncultured Deefgea sp.]|uniref:hypothetical protein n=1 Tax=uncultured Deefgea sp. TaxID=1304914 RepID=UPI00259AD9AC
ARKFYLKMSWFGGGITLPEGAVDLFRLLNALSRGTSHDTMKQALGGVILRGGSSEVVVYRLVAEKIKNGIRVNM